MSQRRGRLWLALHTLQIGLALRWSVIADIARMDRRNASRVSRPKVSLDLLLQDCKFAIRLWSRQPVLTATPDRRSE